MIGSDDVLACFIAGNAFTWDDWFRLETMDDSLQPTIDMLLNVSIFIWFGAVCPWHQFVSNDVVPIYRLIPLGILVLLLRRLPMVLAFHKKIHQIEAIQHAAFVGFFGPIGVSAIFYLYISREFLRDIEVDGVQRRDAARLADIMNVVIWFLAVCSIFVHGLSVPLGKLGFYLPRTISSAISSERASASQSMARLDDAEEPRTYNLTGRAVDEEHHLARVFRRRHTTSNRTGEASPGNSVTWVPMSLLRAGKHILSDIRGSPEDPGREKPGEPNGSPLSESRSSVSGGPSGGSARPNISAPRDARLIGHAINIDNPDVQANAASVGQQDGPRVNATSPDGSRVQSPSRSRGQSPARMVNGVTSSSTGDLGMGWQRSIRFPDEAPRAGGE